MTAYWNTPEGALFTLKNSHLLIYFAIISALTDQRAEGGTMAQASTEPVPYPRGEFSGLVKMNLIQSKLEEASRLRGRCAHARLFEAVELAIDGFAQAVLDHGSSEDLSDVLRDEQALFAHQVRRLIALCRAGEHEIAIEPRLAHLPLYAA